MPRAPRIMCEGWPFHVTHRGNHRKTLFESDEQRREYLDLLRLYSRRYGMRIWSYCLMGNHVHLIVVGKEQWSISRAVGNTHREYSRRRNLERDVTGHAWSNRFFSTVLDEPHLWAAVRYVELNPVRAALVAVAADFEWSSARANGLRRRASRILDEDRPFPGPIRDWYAWLGIGLESALADKIRENTRRGTPSGSESFARRLELCGLRSNTTK
jgi:putative transposase